MSSSQLLKVLNLQKSFLNPEGMPLAVLENVTFEMRVGEIVALLGKSGSGKSTLLRILAGLTPPSSGSVYYRNKLVENPMNGIAMVFQNFALLPWLTVLENVELGLEAQGIPHAIRRDRALKAIDTIGLDGFESAYPKELSGGMRQRVGFARALVVEPDLLLMDEPFSALDILTAENLRNDLLELWEAKRTRTQGILCVTHDIEEAIILSNRIILFTSSPGRIHTEVPIPLPYPRDTEDKAFKALVDKIYTLMTVSERERLKFAKAAKAKVLPHPEYAYRFFDVSIAELTGLLETMESNEKKGHIDLPELSDELHLDVDSLFPLVETLDILRFAKITEGDLRLLDSGRAFVAADIQKRKKLFAHHLQEYIPLVRHIRSILDKKPKNRISKEFFLEELKDYLNEEEAEKLLKVIIDWGRYAELFAYDYDTETLSLENP